MSDSIECSAALHGWYYGTSRIRFYYPEKVIALYLNDTFRSALDGQPPGQTARTAVRELQRLVDNEIVNLPVASRLTLAFKAVEILSASQYTWEATQLVDTLTFASMPPPQAALGSLSVFEDSIDLTQSFELRMDDALMTAQAVVRMADSADITRALYNFAVEAVRTARHDLYEHSTTYDSWCLALRRLHVAITHCYSLNLYYMTRDFIPGEKMPEAMRVKVDSQRRRGKYLDSPSGEVRSRNREHFRKLFLERYYSQEQILRLQQECNMIEEYRANAGVATVATRFNFRNEIPLDEVDRTVAARGYFLYRNSLDPLPSVSDIERQQYHLAPIVAPGGLFVDHYRTELLELAKRKPLEARVRSRQYLYQNLQIPRYVHDEVERVSREVRPE